MFICTKGKQMWQKVCCSKSTSLLLSVSAWRSWWPTLPIIASDQVYWVCSGSRFVPMSATEVCTEPLSLNDLCSFFKSLSLTGGSALVFRCDRTWLCVETLWRYSNGSGPSPWGAAAPAAARKPRQWQHLGVRHTAGLCAQLETQERSGLACPHTGNTCPTKLTHTLPPPSPHTRGGGELLAVAAEAVRVSGDSAQRGPVRRRGSRRECCSRALSCSTRSSAGKDYGDDS